MGGIRISKGQLKTLILMLVIISIFIISVFAVNNSQKNIPTNEFQLFQSFNPVNLLKPDLTNIFLQGNESITATIVLNKEEPKLATVVNGKNIFDNPYTQVYLKHYSNFSDVEFKKIENDSKILSSMRVGNFDNKLKGFVIDNKKYVLDLIACDRETDSCEFRINGVRTGKIYLNSNKGSTSFNLNGKYKLKVNSIKYHICDPDLPVCDKRYEAYDSVEIEIVER